MTSKHTDGPWHVDNFEGYEAVDDSCVIIRTDSDTAICRMEDETGEDWTQEEVEANAKLISAAPDMLNALEAIVKANDACVDYTGCHESAQPQWLKDARKAIAKARGEV